MNQSLTVVLPVYNGESRLRGCVSEILELASELTTKFGVMIVDDGSTDATYEIAEELAAHFPQISVQRHPQRRGLGPILETLRRRLHSDVVIVHDGVSPIDPNQVRRLWRNCAVHRSADDMTTTDASLQQSDICDFANLPAIHAAMQGAHSRVVGFQLVTPQTGDESAIELAPQAPRADAPHWRSRAGVGTIPRLPRPKFLSALAAFALGE
jgi:glycosyltransferase involved in cell wall biosynthesis